MNLSTSSFSPSTQPEDRPTAADAAPRLKAVPTHSPPAGSQSTARRYVRRYALFLALLFLCDFMIGGLLKEGLDRYFGLAAPSPVLCIGHSHTVLGIDKTGLESRLGLPVAKYARQGADLSNRLAMIRHYLDAHPGAVKALVYDVDAHLFTGTGLSANSHRLFYPFMDSYVVRDYIAAQTPDPLEYWPRRLFKLPRFSEVTIGLSIRGWLGKWTNLKYGTVNTERLARQIENGDFRRIAFDPAAVALFEGTLQRVRSRGIHVVLAYIPTIDIFNAAEPNRYREAIRRLTAYAAGDSGVTFLNYNPAFAHRHDLFYDPIHLNPEGQKQVTARLAGDLKRILE
jgi:hypothetical protein